MQTVNQANPPILRPLLAWLAYRLSRGLTSLKPKYSAGDIAMIAARSGNPTGA